MTDHSLRHFCAQILKYLACVVDLGTAQKQEGARKQRLRDSDMLSQGTKVVSLQTLVLCQNSQSCKTPEK